ncbi:hypothetical protein AAY84_07520 [Serratia marcescens]|uniref:hypothetical protein n=1 Tax=Serratia marcescens TaxID=615 RepID=UPI00062CAC80|nr:hypothetical protein [Serratia marcescens]KKZ19028.1 hypothetical protein AAY84_07520 [Serratia marcescens]
MNAEVIKSFLVSLGFEVDNTGEKKFDAALMGVTLNAVKAGAAIEAAALSVVAFTAKIASGLDSLYQASQRTGASAEGIQKLSYAISQAGGSAAAATASLEGMAAFMRNNPGAEGFLNRLGVQTRDAKGNMRDMAAIFTSVGQKLNSMPFYRARQYAQMLGMDDNTLMAMRRGLGQYGEQYSAMAKAIGFDANKAAASSNRFMTSLKAFGTMAGMARDKIGADMAGGLVGSLDRLRKQMLDNFPKIEAVITRGIKGIMWLADMVGHLVHRLIDGADQIAHWWKTLDKSTREFIVLLGALTVALKLVNSAFWSSPIGIITALAGAIFLLWDDYRTWREGGKSLIDWAKWQPDIEKAKKALVWLRDHLLALKDAVGGWKVILEALATYTAGVWAIKMIKAISGVSSALGGLFKFSGKTIAIGMVIELWNKVHDIQKAANQANMSVGDYLTQQMKQKQANGKPLLTFDDITSWFLGLDWHLHPGMSSRGMASGEPEQHAQSAHMPALPDRNNNPGNLRPVSGQGFRSFASALDGWTAMKNQLLRYFTGKTTGHKLQTVWDIVKTWAPAGDHNDPVKYAKDVAGWMHVSPDAVLNLSNPNTLAALMQSMSRKEGYSNWNSQLAYQAANQGRGAQISQQNTYHIYGGNATEVGNEVGRHQMENNAQVTNAGNTRRS